MTTENPPFNETLAQDVERTRGLVADLHKARKDEPHLARKLRMVVNTPLAFTQGDGTALVVFVSDDDVGIMEAKLL